MSEERLSNRVVKGGIWVFAARIADRSFYFIKLIILARILLPRDFGVLGIAMLMILNLETFFRTGFSDALIQRREVTDDYLNSAWTTGIIRGTVLSAIVYIAGPYVAGFFNSPQAGPVVRVIGLSFLLRAFTNIGTIYFQKELEFNKQFLYQLTGSLADFIVAVTAAYLLKNVWALVFGILAGDFIRLIASYVVQPYRPKLSVDFKKARELFVFGKWVWASSITTFLLAQGDNAVVGKVLGAAMLGLYQMAYSIANTPATEFAQLISGITFPAYSKMQGDMSRLRNAYLEVLRMSAFIAIPLAGGIFVLAPEFTRIFLGEKWMPMVPAMRVLAVYGMINAIVAPGPLFMAVGRPDIRTKLGVIGLIIFSVCIYPFTAWWGIMGAALAATTYILMVGCLVMPVAFRFIDSPYITILRTIGPPLLNSMIMVLAVFSAKSFIHLSMNIFQFVLLIFFGIVMYASIAFLFDKIFDYGARAIIKERVEALLSKANS
jgi:lipopolysaccharide exporter